MKRKNDLYEKICNIDNLYKAYKNARLGKGWYEEVKIIEKRPYYYLYGLKHMLENQLYKTSEYKIFEKDCVTKVREIYKLPFYPDRICQWAILQVIQDTLIKNFILDTYSAIPKRGIGLGFKRVKNAIVNDYDNCKYCLKLDIRHFYPTIDHEILKEKYKRLFKDKNLLWLLNGIIDSVDTVKVEDLEMIKNNCKNYGEHIGIPIGNFLSQFSGNLYLSSFDHWIKEDKGIKHYFRYMDDMVIMSNSKEHLHELLKEIKTYLSNELNLVLKNNYQIFPLESRGLDFMGYVFYKDHIRLRKSTKIRMERKMKKLLIYCKNGYIMDYSDWCSINSYGGWISHCNGINLYNKYITPLAEYYIEYYEKYIKKRGI